MPPQRVPTPAFTPQALLSFKHTATDTQALLQRISTAIPGVLRLTHGRLTKLKHNHAHSTVPQPGMSISPDIQRKPEFSLPYPAPPTVDRPLLHMHAPVQTTAGDARLQPLHSFCDPSDSDLTRAMQEQSPPHPGHVNNSRGHEDYARTNETFVEKAPGAHVPVIHSDAIGQVKQEHGSLLAYVRWGASQDQAQGMKLNKIERYKKTEIHGRFEVERVKGTRHTVPILYQSASTPLQHAERNFHQRDVFLHQVARNAVAHNIEAPSPEASLATNSLVQDFYERDNTQLLDTFGHEWESTRLDYFEFCDRVKSNPVHFYEYFPQLIATIREYAHKKLEEKAKVTRITSWPENRVTKERELFERMWAFERGRWNQYARFSSWTEPF